ncbi:MAG: S1 RNA-binding domain-containing protein [Candidatus Cloacimonetes bacterium]|nr:S1 RNA-binding domain-containing protein [Candidatus Cloacimonadota bacterium]
MSASKKKLSPVEQRKLNESLMDAALYGLTDEVRKSIDNGADVDARDEIDNTALVWAASNNNLEIVDLLLQNGANVNSRNSIGWTPLISAANNGNVETVKLLVKYNVDANARDGGGLTALMFACLKDHEEIVKLLLEAGADTNAEDSEGKTAIYYAIESDPTEIVKNQLERGGESADADTSQIVDSKSVRIVVMEALIDKGAKVNIKDKEKTTPLMLAVKKGNSAAVRLLLSRGANIEMKNAVGKTAIEIASEENFLEVERILMDFIAITTGDEDAEFLMNLYKEDESTKDSEVTEELEEIEESEEDAEQEQGNEDSKSSEVEADDKKQDMGKDSKSDETNKLSEEDQLEQKKKETDMKLEELKKNPPKPLETAKVEKESVDELLEKTLKENEKYGKPVFSVHNEKKEREITEAERTFLNSLPPQIVKGKAALVTDNEVIVDVSIKAQCRIPISEFSSYSSINQSDDVLAYIEGVENGGLQILLSKMKADFILNYEKIKTYYEENETVTGIIRRKESNGLVVFVEGVQAFLPNKEIDLKKTVDSDTLIGTTDRFKITSIDSNQSKIVISRKKVLIEEIEEKKRKLKEKIQIEAEFTGDITKVVDYGAFVDLGGIEGLLHISDMPMDYSSSMEDLFKLHQKVKVKVIGYDQMEDILYLALKQQSPMSWDYIKSKYPVRSKAKGKVVNIANFGAFVELEPGVEGLVHISEMSWTKKVNHPKQLLNIGDSIEVMILSISADAKQIAMSIKQLITNPWLDIENRLPVGTKIKRKVKSVSSFGIFIEIEDDIDGLIHISDISWTNCEFDPSSIYSPGEEVEAVVLAIDKPFHRIALGIKQINEDPWANIPEDLNEGVETEVEIEKLTKEGLIVFIKNDKIVLRGFISKQEMALEMLEDPSSAFEAGEKISALIKAIDPDDRTFILSIKDYFSNKDDKELADYVSEREKRAQPKS